MYGNCCGLGFSGVAVFQAGNLSKREGRAEAGRGGVRPHVLIPLALRPAARCHDEEVLRWRDRRDGRIPEWEQSPCWIQPRQHE